MADSRNSFQVPKLNDRSIIEFFTNLAEEFSFPSPHILLVGYDNQLQINGNEELVETIKKSKAKTIYQCHVSKNGFSVVFERGVYKNINGSHARVDSPVFDTFRITAQAQHGIDPQQALSVLQFIQKYFFKDGKNNVAVNDDAVQGALSSHYEIIRGLEQTLADIGEKFAEKRLELEREFDERRYVLQQEIDGAKARADEEIANEKKRLAEAAEGLEQRRKALDDRQNTHVRRDLRQQLKEQFTEYRKAFELTKGTRGLRMPIHVVSIALIAILIAGAAYLATREAPTDTWLYVIFLLKPLGLTFLTVVLATWYINWMNRWFDRHADAEFRLKELELDIDRASWVVETAFEWKESRNNALPDKLLEAISRNLFTSKEEPERSELNPVDHLASALLGQAARAKLNIGGNEIEYERPALKKAGQS